jgi:hypothetical protein
MRRQQRVGWMRTILPVVALVTSSVFLAGCGSSVASPTCTTKQLIEAAGKGFFKLPPSQDNDAGKGRIPDTSPDQDIDANQRAALCKIYERETHSHG